MNFPGCWILPEFTAERLVTEYLWIWITAFVMLVLYLIMFVVTRGWIIVDNGIHWHKSYNHPIMPTEVTPADEEARATARILLLYAQYLFKPSMTYWCSMQLSRHIHILFPPKHHLSVVDFYQPQPPKRIHIVRKHYLCLLWFLQFYCFLYDTPSDGCWGTGHRTWWWGIASGESPCQWISSPRFSRDLWKRTSILARIRQIFSAESY